MNRTPDLIGELGELGLASRLRRLSERLFRDISRVYREMDVDFEARWFPVLQALRARSPQAVTELASRLRLTHAAVNQLAGAMAARGFVRGRRDSKDERRRLLDLTPAGHRLANLLDPIWEEIRVANRELLDELIAEHRDILAALALLETRLDERDMYERVSARLRLRRAADPAVAVPRQRLEILPYRPAWRRHFEALNREWLEKEFAVEESDAALLADPYGKIVKPGGAIYFARLDGRIVGTGALIRHTERIYELAKMAVAETERGHGIGRRLAEALLTEARAQEVQTLFLETSPRLVAVRRWYERLGFRRTPNHPLGSSKYTRRSFAMVLEQHPARAKSRKGVKP
jgi:N-acetylglutamate synthase-like GNAT family acetyltransferase/DNA-binding MarR family transcriptional regulator